MRKRRAKKRILLPDPKFNDQMVTRFVNNLMWDGKKSVAFKVFYDALDIVEEKKQDEEKSSLEIWKDALGNVMPQVEVRSRRVGGATFQIPQQIRPDRKISMAIKWLISYTRKRNEKTMAQKLAAVKSLGWIIFFVATLMLFSCVIYGLTACAYDPECAGARACATLSIWLFLFSNIAFVVKTIKFSVKLQVDTRV
jgi:small subunit ribosomal protein S7